MVHPITAAEVKLALLDIAEDKAPGPDGYTSDFYKVAWPIVGVQVPHAIIDFYTTGRLLNPSQTPFVSGRSISDNILLAQELFSGYNQQRYHLVVLSRWISLFGFSNKFINWIEKCVTTPSFSIGNNGTPHGFFVGARGLRQGDPKSPYLFILIMEVLNLILQQLIDQDMNFAFHWKYAPLCQVQLGFADDLLLFS
ncbi:uncharacterized protein LOC105157070 [Sesamum indicum]|uniref:Uncharacterized protein LOC105157070 n=1 Tax=Sesamum indicum TaxID=4182 RepID=A0A6I9SR43_SESIN|nr:uncharacterized protein LOC105157070 [Sesamum indicum]